LFLVDHRRTPPQENTEAWREYQRKRVKHWRCENPERARELRRRDNAKLSARGYFKEWGKNNYRKNRVYFRQKLRERHAELRRTVIEHYGNKCARCNEGHLEFLTIDHIAGGGTRHREELARRNQSLFRWLKKNEFPKGFRVLCMGCNQFLGRNRTKDPTKWQKERACNARLRARVIQGYGGKCKCCGENDWDLLCIDHINGGGRKHRESLDRKGGAPLNRWIIKNAFPDFLRILCANCNHSLGHYGHCPHERERLAA
jgi:hypothetical protein